MAPQYEIGLARGEGVIARTGVDQASPEIDAVPGTETLQFFLGGRELASVQVSALTLTVPFSRLSTNLDQSTPYDHLPPGVGAFVIPAHPVSQAPPRRLAFTPHMIRYTSRISDRYSISLAGTFADYMKKFGTKSRHNLTRSVRKFAEFSGGKIEFREFTRPEQMKEFRQLADQILEHSWGIRVRGKNFTCRLPEGELVQFAYQGVARGFILFHRDEPIAYALCRANEELLLYQYIAYDERYAKWSPGSILLYLMIERLFAEQQYQRLDLGDGTLGYKSYFATDATPCVRVMYFSRTMRNLAMVSVHLGLSAGSVALGRMLGALGLKQKLKRLLMGKMWRPGQELYKG